MALRNVSITAQGITVRSVKFTWATRVAVMRKAAPAAIASKESKPNLTLDASVPLDLVVSVIGRFCSLLRVSRLSYRAKA